MSTVSEKLGGHVPIQDQADPNGVQLGEPGAKLDLGKQDLLTALRTFPRALSLVSEVARYGAEDKGYGWGAWRHVVDGESRYTKALVRHLIVTGDDQESKLPHAAHAAWNALAVLELSLEDET